MRLSLVSEVCACTKLAVASLRAAKRRIVKTRELSDLDDINTFAHKCECISSVRQSGSTGSGEKAGLSDPALDGEFVVSAFVSSSESFSVVRVTW